MHGCEGMGIVECGDANWGHGALSHLLHWSRSPTSTRYSLGRWHAECTDPASLYVDRSISRNASTAFFRAATCAIYAKAKTMHPVTAQNLAAE